ncbi:hypothetical protein [Glycomyces buryatensis]|uniref:Uncharacterized protein n=1 Tax=Glycomyces buryatensis TaxID=2570927 RepID=A0A4S8Q372_9ACTN|nr:hypothetical protein [Glycomyces buryatensis]THV36965.1 hypothetical protein FAB82_20605 [Glycomyces buryatensis]
MGSLSPADRLRMAFEMHEVGRRMYIQKLKRARSGLTEPELREELLQWLLNAPGAENGDYPGPRSQRRIRTWSTCSG